MKTLALTLACLIIVIAGCMRWKDQRGLTHITAVPKAGVFFVATNGNDAWSGTLAEPNLSKSNGPFQTVTRALQAVVDLKQHQSGESQQPIRIFVRGGMYFLSQPVVLTPQHSGTPQAPLIIAAYRAEHPVLSAGCPIGHWRPVTVDGKQLWAAPVPEARDAKWFFHQLWVKGERRTRARHPNTGYFQIAALPDATASWELGHSRFQFKEGDIPQWTSIKDGDVVAMTRWVESRLPIAAIDEKQRIVSSTKRSVFQLQPGDPYYVEHVFEALDQPGEWFLDRGQGLLYYKPLPGERIDGFEAVAPQLVDCLRIEGKPETGKFVENVLFRGLTFSHNEWYFPSKFASSEAHISSTPDPEILGFAQAAYGVPGAVQGEGVRNCAFEDCHFTNLGSYGLQLGRACQSNRVSCCEFSDLSAGGIRIGETIIRTNAVEQTHDNVVTDCVIADGGKMFHSAIGVWIGQSFGNQLAHNLIRDFYYTGISIGWSWGYGPSLASNNVVEFNHVHHIGQKSNGDGPILSDMGGIYTLGLQPGTAIRNNFWHDIYGLRYGGWGIYFDEGSTGIVAENNIVYGTTHGGFHQHYGKENVVRNNVFALARNHQLQRTRAEDHTSFTFERNIVCFDHGKLLEGNWTDGKFNQDNNTYVEMRTNKTDSLNFPGGLAQWRDRGHDLHSTVANPPVAIRDFASFPRECDAALLPAGFHPFDLKQAGPRQRRH